MHVLIIRSGDPNATTEYTVSHVQRIREIDPSISVKIIDSVVNLVSQYLPKTEILIVSKYNYANILDFTKASVLKWVHTTSAGSDEIALALKDTPILLTNSSGVHPIPIAEHVFAFMLMFARKFELSYRNQIESKNWIEDSSVLSPTELHHKTIGVVGFGRVGKRIACVAKGFDMQVCALKFTRPIYDLNVDRVYSYSNLSGLLGTCDFVVNCLPLTSETRGFFNFTRFQQMLPTSVFVNVGRGNTVVTEDLIQALHKRIIAGAGLDVVEEEPLPVASELWNMKNVIITPHNAGRTPAYMDRVIDIFCANLKAFLNRQPMPNLVNKTRGY